MGYDHSKYACDEYLHLEYFIINPLSNGLTPAQQASTHLIASSPLFLTGWRTVRGNIQVKCSPCFAMPETWAFFKKQASPYWCSKVSPTPPNKHSSASDDSNGYGTAALEEPHCYAQLHLHRRDSHISGTVPGAYANSDHTDRSPPVITGAGKADKLPFRKLQCLASHLCQAIGLHAFGSSLML